MKSLFARGRRTRTIIFILIALLLMWGGYRLWFAPAKTEYQFATAARGTLTEIVSVTGNTAPVQDVDLAFEIGGTIAATNAVVGSSVSAGDVIARLDTSDLSAQLAQSQANADAQAAKLQSLKAGSRPEDIAAAQASLDKARQDLANMYSSVPSALTEAYAKANDAVRNQISALFTNAETTNPQLTFTLNDAQLYNDIRSERVQASNDLNLWKDEIASISASSPASLLETVLAKASKHLLAVQDLLATAAQALIGQTDLSASTLATYKTAVANAIVSANSAVTTVNNSSQGISSQKLTVAGLQASLNKAIAGPTAEDIAAQQAQVAQAVAASESIRVKISKASLRTPVTGTVTKQDTKIGQIASPGVVLVSVISNGLEVDANIPEADIGKVKAGNAALMTLDAFPGRTFTGKVVYINPGATVIEGVPTYKATFEFVLGPEVKPGMTANIDVTTATHADIIFVPQRAVATNIDGSRTIKVFHGSGEELEERAVTVGIRDTNGNIEIVSGLSEGEQVVR